jgi:hypothetical protein
MLAESSSALVQPVRNPYLHSTDRRDAPRHPCALQATSQALESGETLSWGAVVHDISADGIGVTLCYPFRPGTYLDIELQTPHCMLRSLMVRVVNVHDQRDGMWRLGCEFVKPLTQSDMELLV